ncbi:hypothetical protein FBY05_101665 [Pseudomonas sp. SJZ083]|nr:hypothetical protein FBY05_101665 [Pseudomonas sp. SJZ083]TWC53863.1 hypothetical protein FBY01_10151 [Pseudomonas sp. SJZ077]
MGSDVDLLACVDGPAGHIDSAKYSIYKYDRLRALWAEGNPFAWHLHLESKLLFSSDGSDFLSDLGKPARYRADFDDCDKFKKLFDRSYFELTNSSNSATFHLSCIFLAIRNFATCHSLSVGNPIFSRQSPLLVQPRLEITSNVFSILTRARLLSTRGFGENITREEVITATEEVAIVPMWMETLRRSQSL